MDRILLNAVCDVRFFPRYYPPRHVCLKCCLFSLIGFGIHRKGIDDTMSTLSQGKNRRDLTSYVQVSLIRLADEQEYTYYNAHHSANEDAS